MFDIIITKAYKYILFPGSDLIWVGALLRSVFQSQILQALVETTMFDLHLLHVKYVNYKESTLGFEPVMTFDQVMPLTLCIRYKESI